MSKYEINVLLAVCFIGFVGGWSSSLVNSKSTAGFLGIISASLMSGISWYFLVRTSTMHLAVLSALWDTAYLTFYFIAIMLASGKSLTPMQMIGVAISWLGLAIMNL